jgi:biotin-dependent carboxylase-like uncharacterized protein
MSDQHSKGFLVRQPGLMTLIQDAGRFGQHGIGLTCGGPLDADAFYWANRLCGNVGDEAALEVSFGGLALEAQLPTMIAVTGADVVLTINGEEQPQWQSHAVKPGDNIKLGYATAGCRAYLAVKGGFNIKPSFGSVATVAREGVGGLNGGKLIQGDLLPCASHINAASYQLLESHRPIYTKSVTLRVILGYQKETFSSLALARFFSSEYTTTDRSDRMGYRLEGSEIKSSINGILSEGICHGVIQVPADGQPIVLLNDRQTIGGYPKLGSVISLDTAKLAQLTPGAKVNFEEITIDDAHALHLLHRQKRISTELISC